MPTIHAPHTKCQTLDLRIKAEERDWIDRAARATGKNRTEVLLDATRRTAEEAMLDQALLRVGPEAFACVQARLDAQPEPNERLRETMQAGPPWDKA